MDLYLRSCVGRYGRYYLDTTIPFRNIFTANISRIEMRNNFKKILTGRYAILFMLSTHVLQRNYTSTKLMKSRERNQKRRTLQRIILAVLQGDPDLYYYQVARLMAAVFLLALEDNDLAVQLLQKATSTYFRPCMRSNFDSVLCTVRLLFVLIQLQDNDLYQHLRQSKV
ncbi:unnamed protein product [Albugo candida]|uniref:Rab-GAP TBC domain-containing protein n=1 Tax=Albugo candida TaxID=65357 RepID=A0A024FZH2_9STRA|nr:unnamed protein product [Albugo candida]|eukprot:CCI39450.1 unnamed protein product [Albugo candida]